MRIQEAFDLIKQESAVAEERMLGIMTGGAPRVSEVASHILKSGGKRLRPLALLLASKLLGRTDDSHINMAVVVEYIHTATLLHDDVVDEAKTRRGVPSANTVWDNGSSILAGDYLLAKAFSLAVAQSNLRALKVLSDSTAKMAEGEAIQLARKSDMTLSEEEYLKIIESKTAVLFSASSTLPAILSNAPKATEDALFNYGTYLGKAFQLVDDCLDYQSTDDAMGKPTGNDLREGKLTLPLIKTLKATSDRERAIISAALEADELSSELKTVVLSFVTKYNGVEQSLDLAKKMTIEAKKSLEHFEPTPERAALAAVADYVIERNF